MPHRHANAHLGDLEDGDRLLGALAVCQQQLQSSISIKVGHGTTCSEQNTFSASYISPTGRVPSKLKESNKGTVERWPTGSPSLWLGSVADIQLLDQRIRIRPPGNPGFNEEDDQ